MKRPQAEQVLAAYITEMIKNTRRAVWNMTFSPFLRNELLLINTNKKGQPFKVNVKVPEELVKVGAASTQTYLVSSSIALPNISDIVSNQL